MVIPDGAGRVLVCGPDSEDTGVSQDRVRYGHKVLLNPGVLENELWPVVVQISNLNVNLR